MGYKDSLLSVVVPCYNIELYIRECIASILNSTYPNIEVILVDDGSVDSTPEICDELARVHPEVVVVHQNNQGLGAARNTGIGLAKGEFLAFVDSDDLVIEDAYAAMIDSLNKTGSSACVGGVERFNSQRVWKPWFVNELHGIDRLSTDAKEFPPIVWNVFAWSKVFRRVDFDEIVGHFPVDILYEDQEMSMKLYTSGRCVDVLSKTVYRWRARDDNSSITQNKTSVFDLLDRLEVARHAVAVVEASGDMGLMEYWYRKFLGEDLWWYFRVVKAVSDDYWRVLVSGVQEFVDRAPVTVVPNLDQKRQDLVVLAYNDNRRSFEERLSYP